MGSSVVYDGFDLARNDLKVVSAREGSSDGIELWVHDLGAGGDELPG